MGYMDGTDYVVLQGGEKVAKPLADIALKTELDGKASPQLSVTGEDDADGTGTFTIQVQDIDGNALSGRFLLRVWLGTSAYGGSSAATDFSVDTGTALDTVLSNADIEVITDSDGKAVMKVEDAAEHHVMASAGGPIFTGSVTVTS